MVGLLVMVWVGLGAEGGGLEVCSRDCGRGLRKGRYDSTTTTDSLGVGPLGFGLEVPEDSKKGAWRDWVWGGVLVG